MLLDTNLLIGYVRKHSHPPEESFISTITVGEIKSMATQNNWGKAKLLILEQIFDQELGYFFNTSNQRNLFEKS